MIKTKRVKLLSEGTKGRFAQCVADVVQFNDDHGISHEHMPTMSNLFYHGLCLAGEAGEVANVIKKIWRDGDSEAARKHLEEEIVDMAIFMGMIVKITGMDFDAAWEAKHRELYTRWADKLIGKRKVDMIQFTGDHILTNSVTGDVRVGENIPSIGKKMTVLTDELATLPEGMSDVEIAEAFDKVRQAFSTIIDKAPGYDWNADPLYLTRQIGESLDAVDKVAQLFANEEVIKNDPSSNRS